MKKQDKYREQLQQRSIQPSEAVWEQLSEQLDAYEHLQKREKWGVLKYVAIILVIVSAGFYFFQPETEIISEEKMENPSSKESIEKEPITHSKKEILIADVEEVSKPIQPKKQKTQQEFKKIEEVVVIEKNVAENKNITIEIETKTTINTVANNEVTDTEIEQLLKNANIKVKETHQNLNQKSVSAQALLVEVEDDLNKDFKDKLLQTIVTTLKTPREITISDRGN